MDVRVNNLEVDISTFIITEENNKFELYKVLDKKSGGISYTKVRNEIEKDLDISDITPADLQDDIIAPSIIEEYREKVTKRMKNWQYMNFVAGYVSSVLQDFGSYLRTEVDLIGDDIKLILDEYNSSFITYELQPGINTFKDISEALFNNLQTEYPRPSNVIDIEFDNTTRKTKLVVENGIMAMRFDGKSFFNTILAFTSGWDNKHYNKYISQNIVNLSSTNKIHLKCDVIDGSIQDGIRQPIPFSLVLDKPGGYKIVCEPETIHYKKINESILNTITFYLEDDNNEQVDFNGKTLTFTLQMIKF